MIIMSKFQEVKFSKHSDWFMGENRPFWRADLNGITIATLCRTKAECVLEAKKELKRKVDGGSKDEIKKYYRIKKSK